eukprot:m.110152 g.110152  ORF g.110152 m.110152 type:complete len:419 (+) comp14023_c0_seq5:240-1496(+)
MDEIPASHLGVALGIAGLGRVIVGVGGIHDNTDSLSTPSVINLIIVLLSCVHVVLYSLKVFSVPKAVIFDLCDTHNSIAFCAFGMYVIVLSPTVKDHFGVEAGQITWALGVGLHYCALLNFMFNVFIRGEIDDDVQKSVGAPTDFWFYQFLKRVTPAFFVPVVGVAVSTSAVAGYSREYVAASVILCLSTLGMLVSGFMIILSATIYPYAKRGPRLYTVGVFMAPASLCFAGLINLLHNMPEDDNSPLREWFSSDFRVFALGFVGTLCGLGAATVYGWFLRRLVHDMLLRPMGVALQTCGEKTHKEQETDLTWASQNVFLTFPSDALANAGIAGYTRYSKHWVLGICTYTFVVLAIFMNVWVYCDHIHHMYHIVKGLSTKSESVPEPESTVYQNTVNAIINPEFETKRLKIVTQVTSL